MRKGQSLEILDTKTVEKLVEETEKERDAEAEAKKRSADAGAPLISES